MELQVNLKEWLKKLVYMKTEVDTKLSSKANTNHTHDIASLPDETDMLGHMENDFYTALDTKANKTTATTSANGLMSKEDKSKLDDIATEANKTIVDSSLSSSSTNPVQNKVVNNALNKKANSSHSHSISNITNLQSALDSKSATGHTHDERYYTETEMNTKLNGKANSSHSHSISNITNLQSALDSKSATGHNHDERYYTETEMDKKLNGKADSNHTHDYIPSTVSQNVFGSGDSKVTATRQGNVVTLRLHFIGDFAETWKQWCTITDPQYLPDTDEEFTDFGITSSYGRHMLLRINSDGRVRTGYGGNVNTSSYQTITFLKK